VGVCVVSHFYVLALSLTMSAPAAAAAAAGKTSKRKHKTIVVEEPTDADVAAMADDGDAELSAFLGGEEERAAALAEIEEPVSKKQAVPAAAAAAGALVVVEQRVAAKGRTFDIALFPAPKADIQIDEETGDVIGDANPPTPDFMETRYFPTMRKLVPLVRAGRGRTNNPDIALHAVSIVNRWNLHDIETHAVFTKDPSCIQIERDQPKIWDAVQKKRVAKPGSSFFINIKPKHRPSFGQPGADPSHDLVPGDRLCGMTPWFVPSGFFKFGSTLDTGVEGSYGKVVDGQVTTANKAKYEVMVTERPYSAAQTCPDTYANPVAVYFMRIWNDMWTTLFMRTLVNAAAMPKLREWMANNGHGGLTDLREIVTTCKKAGKIKTLGKAEKNDPSAQTVSMGVSIHRPLRKTWIDKKEILEDLSAYVPPTPMFADARINTEQVPASPQTHNQLACYRSRTQAEIDAWIAEHGPDVPPPSPFIRIPWENVAFNHTDILSVIYVRGIYEWRMDRAGGTNKPLGYLWLNKVAAFKALGDNVPFVDPRYGIPGAGVYRGPLDEAADSNAAMAAMQAAAAAAAGSAYPDA
jgi:hypothetical protein